MKKIAVLAKQVPDTANVTGEAMKADGTVNRAALPAVFNPEDLNALEMALQIKEKLGEEIPVVTLYTYPTIRSLELYLTREQSDQEDDPGLIAEGKDLMRMTLNKLDNGD